MQLTRYTPQDLRLLPDQPGVYRFYNAESALIYVGKAKSIRKRVSSYFNSGAKQHNLKTHRMVAEIVSIDFTIVNSEYEALLLENNLIKKGQPKYNILLKDGKTYPYICITQERFPRVIPTRRVTPRLGKYYGPFTNQKAMYQLLDLIKRLYQLRTCTYQLSEKNIRQGKYKVCLEYHMGNCKGPCAGHQAEEDYNHTIAQVAHILKGNLQVAKKAFREQMHHAAQRQAYEEAQACKEKLTALDDYQAKSLVINPQMGDLDVIGIVGDEAAAFVSYLQIKHGAITFTQTVEIKKKLAEADEDILALIIIDFRERYGSQAPEVLTNLPLAAALEDVTLVVPKIGDKKKLVELAVKNALFFKRERFIRKTTQQEKGNRTLQLLQQDLQLKQQPAHIECFDNSNIQGSNPVAAMVCFRDGKPAKRDYRHFSIKTVTGPDDFASMHEVVRRRYQRLVEEDSALPDLIVIDGGKGQLSAAVRALKDVGIYGQVPIVGIAKRLEEIYFPEDPYPLHISKKSAALKLLQRIRNEAHRFAITFHRNKRSKASLRSVLSDIPGVGPKTTATLLKEFKSVKNMQAASLEELAQHIGAKKAAALKEQLMLIPSS